MTVLSSEVDKQNLMLVFVAEFDAPPDRVWRVWSDPRQLERWWGPPTWPATFTELNFVVGGRAAYFMTGPDGTTAHGWWRITEIVEPRRLVFVDGFADADGKPTDEFGETTTTVTFEPISAGTRMTLVGKFADLEQLEKMAQMGMQEGMSAAMAQIDAVLADHGH